ncbi:lipoprotein [Paracoccus cavernae]
MKRLFTAAILATLTLSGCNTVAGVGEDITGASRLVQGGVSGGGY